jgi:two-component system chemotaxis response regulator CheY
MDKERRGLIAEHDFSCRWNIQRLLEPYVCCDVATCGEEAVLAFRWSYEEGMPYDLILLDSVLPAKGGGEVFAQMRGIERVKKVPDSDRAKVVLVTSLDDDQAAEDALRSQCEGWVVKPIAKSDFLGQLHSLGFLRA